MPSNLLHRNRSVVAWGGWDWGIQIEERKGKGPGKTYVTDGYVHSLEF